MDTIRLSYIRRLEKSQNPEVRELGNFLRVKDKNGNRPCFGEVVSKVMKDFKSLQSKISLWSELLHMREENSILLFVKYHLEQPDVMRVVLDSIDKLPGNVQRYLLIISETESFLGSKILPVTPEIQSLKMESKEKKNLEKNKYDLQIDKLLKITHVSPATKINQ